MSTARPEMIFTVPFIWRDFNCQSGQRYCYPSPVTGYMKDLYKGPCVYRWLFKGPDGIPVAVYVGETENIILRLGIYLCPRGRKLLRIDQYLAQSSNEAIEITLQFLEFETFVLNVEAFGSKNLNDPFKRKAIENLAICDAFQLNCEILNYGVDLGKKRLQWLLRDLGSTPENREKIWNMPIAEYEPLRRRKRNTRGGI